MNKYFTKEDIQSAVEDVKQLELSYTAGGHVN